MSQGGMRKELEQIREQAMESGWLRVPSPNDAEMAYRCGYHLWRPRRIAFPGTALVAVFSRAPAHGPVGGWVDEGGRGGARHRRRERVIVWDVPPCDGQPVFLYFHGNGGSLRWRDERFHDLIADGSGLVPLGYRGYGGSASSKTLRLS